MESWKIRELVEHCSKVRGIGALAMTMDKKSRAGDA